MKIKANKPNASIKAQAKIYVPIHDKISGGASNASS
jgi:hypothetical protein